MATALERVKLSAELANLIGRLRAGGGALERARAASRVAAILAALGVGQKNSVLSELADVAAGRFDDDGITDLLGRIEKLTSSLEHEDDKLTAQAHEAITHWVLVEESAA